MASVLWLGVVPGSRVAYAEGDVTRDIAPVTAAELRHDVRRLPLIYAPAPPYRPLRRPPIRKIGAPAGESEGPPLPAPPAPMPAAIQNFPGLSLADLCSGTGGGSGWPPDPNGDVGLGHYFEAVNDSYAIYSKTGTLLASFTAKARFSGTGPNPCNGQTVSDPIMLYDQQANRWILTHLARARR